MHAQQQFRRSLIAATIALTTLSSPALSGAFIDSAEMVRPPVAPEPRAYGEWGPASPDFPKVGEEYVDPKFGTTVRRLTAEYPHASESDIYARNGYWNADGTLMWHKRPDGSRIIRVTSDPRGRWKAGDVVRTDVPGNYDSSFAPDDPDTWYHVDGAGLYRYSVRSGVSTLMTTFSAPLGSLGGSTDWIDASGRYMLLLIGSDLRLYDVRTNSLYAGAIRAGVSEGWAGISPDANYVVVASGQNTSYAINHHTRTLGSTGVMFWNRCGDHGDLVSASDGRTYLVTFECTDEGAVYAVDVSLPQNPHNKKLLGLDWNDTDGHFSGVSRGPLRNWVFISIESRDDDFGADVRRLWRPHMQEIMMANVLTGEIRRLAHHRSRGIDVYYRAQPRVSASWDGRHVAWTSNFGNPAPEYDDVYVIDIPVTPLDNDAAGAVQEAPPRPNAENATVQTPLVAVSPEPGIAASAQRAPDTRQWDVCD